ncbi:hypothetical protein EMGBS15_07910 [Filimonas sp.]|nr:hypothetical protein EMGBS15_07910 [Filimonas sp.]
MRKNSQLVFIILFSLLSTSLIAQPANLLQECWKKQAGAAKSNYLTLTYSEKRSELEKNFDPWHATNYKGNGMAWCNTENFQKLDSMISGKRSHLSRIQYSKNTLLKQNYDARILSPVSKSMLSNYILQTARYSPVMLLDYFNEKSLQPEKESTSYYALYKAIIDKKIVSLYIRKSDSLLYQVTILEDDPFLGDLLTTMAYDEFMMAGSLKVPSKIAIRRFNNKVNEEVVVSNAVFTSNVTPLLVKPAVYNYVEEPIASPAVSVEKYTDQIHFITLKHTDDKAMVVEFKDFLLIAEAPGSTTNGELILREAKNIAPSKPVRYFVAGHHHADYMGGLRAFVSEGSQIICNNANREYIKYIANAPHTLNPDELQLHPKPLVLDTLVGNSKVITDGKLEMKIYWIGIKSQHTSDFMMYYFPAEKMLFEDDLTWIRKDGYQVKANVRQAALYNAIKELKLDVKTIIQSSPANSPNVLSVIPFEELEKTLVK